MQGAGRGQDSMLVHMTPGEVQGLQSLALAHGGSLTINPKTGLPEAGILSSLLPMIAGFALGPGGFQLMTAAQAGLAVGAVSTLATGSLSKGIMAGLGAYGGAGLGGGLSAVGGAGATSTGAAGVNPAMIGQTMGSAAMAPVVTNTMPAVASSAAANQAASGAIPQLTGFGPVAGPASGTPFTNPLLKTPGVALGGPGTNALGVPVRAAQQINAANITPLAQPTIAQAPISPNQTMQGLKASTSNGLQGLKNLYGAMEKDSPYSGMAAGYSLMSAMNEQPSPPTKKKSLIRPYNLRKDKVLDPNVGPGSSAERNYFDTEWTALTPYEAPGPEYAASGGMMGMAEGGYVDEALSRDAVSMDSGRPLPQQQPIYMGMQPQQSQQNIIAQPGNTMTTPGFAEGGSTLFYNEKTGKVEPKPTVTAGAVGPTGQPLDASGGYIGNYGVYYNAQGEQQPYYMNPNVKSVEANKARAAAGVTLPSATTASAPVTTQEGLEALYQQNFGRAADTSGIESYLGKGYTPEQITGFMQASEEYKPIQEKKAAEAKQATYANPTQIANAYSKVFGRTPDMAGLDYYSGQNLTPAEIEQQLRQSEEYKKKLTTPLVAPISYTGSALSYDDVKKQLGHNPSMQEIATATRAFVPNRATIEGAPQYQTPEQRLGLAKTNALDSTPDFYAMMNKKLAEQGGYAGGGDINAYSLGGYSDGGRLLRGPGDGVSDSIPASIGDRQPARLADGEFVVPARIVSELGNGSTEAGAKRLYAMMDRVQKARSRTMGKGKVAVNSKADKYLPA
jgi:hypothetical protein